MRLRCATFVALSSIALAQCACAQVAVLSGAGTPSSAPALSSPWLQTDIGSPLVAGEASDSQGVFTIRGQGDLDGTSDTGHLVYQALSGDYDIRACIQSLTGDTVWVRGGLIVRDLGPNDADTVYVSNTLDNEPTQGYRWQIRTSEGGNDTWEGSGSAVSPSATSCARITYSGGVFTAYHGADLTGSTWTQYGTPQALTFATTNYWGAWCSSGGEPGLSTCVMTLHIQSASGSAGTLQFTSSTYQINEDVTPLAITVSRAGGTSGAASIDVVDLGTGSASAGTDYTAFSPCSLSWTDAEGGNKTCNVTIIDRSGDNGNRTIDLDLQSVMGATEGTPNTATVTILETDSSDPVLSQGSTNYFVNPNDGSCNNSHNGQYGAFVSGSNGPWCTNAAAEARSFNSATDNLWLVAGSTQTGSTAVLYNASITGTLSGTCTRTFIVGSYYNDSGTMRRGLGGGNRPIIQGSSTYYDHQGNGSPTLYPTNRYAALIGVDDTRMSCTRWENLNVKNSGGRGMTFKGTTGVQVYNVKFENIWDTAIPCTSCTDHVVENSFSTGANFIKKIDNEFPVGGNIQCLECIRPIYRGNIVWDGWGEGVSIVERPSSSTNATLDAIVEDNFVFDVHSSLLYMAARRSIIRRNIIARSSRSNYHTSPGSYRGGNWGVTDEIWFYTSSPPALSTSADNVLYSNIIIAGEGGYEHWQYGSSVNENIYFYGNLFIDSNYDVRAIQPAFTNGRWWSNWFHSFTGGMQHIHSDASNPGGTRDANFFSGTRPAGWQDAQDVTSGCTLVKTSGWRNLENLGTAESDGRFSESEIQVIKAAIIAGARPTSSAACDGTGTAIASRTFPANITIESGPANTDFDGNAYTSADIGPFRQ